MSRRSIDAWALSALALLAIGTAGTAAAQTAARSVVPIAAVAIDPRLQPVFDNVSARATHTEAVPLLVTQTHNDYRWEGLAIGAIGLGILGAVFGAGLCDSDSGARNCTYAVIGGAAVSALIGGVTGGFIGSTIPKRAASPP